jgi:RNA polymerase sigma factor (sigma-70 family)
MQPLSDAQLLRDYAERGAEAAFAEIVARHTDLVYSAALRQVYSPDLARDVIQSVFTDLARKARTVSANLSPEASLIGWLYRGTRFAARDLYRNETRRTQRERQAMEQLHPALETTPDWEQLRPVLDDAMSELDDTDRDAVLLRYFKNHDLHTVGATLGISDDAAQKRVTRAVERLREFFAKRGVTVGASGLAIVISANAVQAAPVGLALIISTAAALTGATLTTTATVTATKAIAMTTLQKTIVTATIAVLAGGGIYEARQASLLCDQVQTLQQQQAPLAEQIQQLSQALIDATNRLAVLRDDNERLKLDTAELLKLRGEIGALRNTAQGMRQVESDPIQIAAKSWLVKVDVLKKWIEQRPEEKTPEFQYLLDYDWLDAVKMSNMEGDYAPATAAHYFLRERAKRQFAHEIRNALRCFVEEHDGDLPTILSQLNSYMQRQMDDEILKSYRLRHSGKLAELSKNEWLVEQNNPPFDKYDDRRLLIRIDDDILVRRDQ